MILLEAKNLSKTFGASKALNDVNLTLECGRIVGLLGPNGSGKTTFLKIINGLLVPTSGNVWIGGETPGIITKQHISYLPDTTFFPKWMKVSKEMLQRLGIKESMKLGHMSKGTLEKTQLVLTMSRDASLFCLDEPIGGVDPATRDYILQTIINNYSENATVLISTHLIADIENTLDDVIFLQNGQVRLNSTVDEIRAKEGQSVDSLLREVFRC